MRWLPLIVSFALAVAVVPAALTHMREIGTVRDNYRGRSVPFPAGWIIVAVGLVALGPLALVDRVSHGDVALHGVVVVYVVGIALLGVLDDLLGSPAPGQSAPRGWRGHLGAVASGRFSTGALKAVGGIGLAVFVASAPSRTVGEQLLAAALLALTTNLFNLLDLRPGRSAKVLVLTTIGVTAGASDVAPLQSIGLFLGSALVLGVFDLRERAMMGDVGANVLGALAGILLIASLDTTGQAIALAVVLLVTVYGEFRSITSLVERTPGLRQLDSIGRPA